MSFSEKKITEKSFASQGERTNNQGKLFDLQPVDNKRIEVSFTAPSGFLRTEVCC